MCAEFGVKSPATEVAAHFQLATPPVAPLAANYFPKAQVPVIGLRDDGVTRNLIRVRWGLVPNHYPDPDSGPRPFNAKAETVHRLWTFRESFRERRCLFPADQFFEWTGTKPKRRFRCGLRTGGLFGVAGIWDHFDDGTTKLFSCCMITTTPNDAVASIPHHRMPAILHPDDYAAWLDPDAAEEELRALLRPFPAGLMAVEPEARGRAA